VLSAGITPDNRAGWVLQTLGREHFAVNVICGVKFFA